MSKRKLQIAGCFVVLLMSFGVEAAETEKQAKPWCCPSLGKEF